MFEEMLKALLGFIFKPNAAGEVEMQIDVLLSCITLVAFVALYRFKLVPLFKALDEALPAWQQRATKLDDTFVTISHIHAIVNDVKMQVEKLDVGREDSEELMRELQAQLTLAEQSVQSISKSLHSTTQRSILDWLERSEDRMADPLKELSVIQSEIRNLSTLLMATSVSRFNKPLS
ncbi:hypothetical protein [Pseudoalteromonas umbrosa]|uniref:hypothetical protein n=1 Tax=Pseudoalteromonas umbrosa TaxID=3048489 RepID=UPI0024C2B93D|nr:hypothetical protein [Pseudoalteromonas sp. B95]MDK1290241.1 hypothetical protein [Pseudoalteromonas sp. B95]